MAPGTREFSAAFSQFERICWHWAEMNRLALEELSQLPPERTMFVRLEELRAAPSEVRALYDFLDLPWRDEAYGVFARPHNVNRPEDRLLDPVQRGQFEAIAGRYAGAAGLCRTPGICSQLLELNQISSLARTWLPDY